MKYDRCLRFLIMKNYLVVSNRVNYYWWISGFFRDEITIRKTNRGRQWGRWCADFWDMYISFSFAFPILICWLQILEEIFHEFLGNSCVTTYIPSRTMETYQSEHTQSLHYLNIRQFFTCLNFISLIKFHFAKLDFAPSRFISL